MQREADAIHASEKKRVPTPFNTKKSTQRGWKRRRNPGLLPPLRPTPSRLYVGLLELTPDFPPAIEAISAASADLAVNWTSWIAAVAWVLTAGVLGYALFQHSRDEF
ncbi:MAG: hypothetical protein ACFCVA_19980, partial [Gammaproteobacteria bacterium]